MKNKKNNISDIVYKIIEEKIFNKEWTPGMKIASENELSQGLGVSRVSVREAVEKMVALNILNKRQGEGTFVNELSPSMYLNSLIPLILIDKDNLLDVLEFRRVIEVDSARLCAERCDDENIRNLDRSYELMCEYNDESEKFVQADYEFHMEIARGTKNSLIIKINSIMMNILQIQQEEINKKLGPDDGIRDHKKILSAIKNRDGELAELYMRRHIERTINDIRKITGEFLFDENKQ